MGSEPRAGAVAARSISTGSVFSTLLIDQMITRAARATDGRVIDVGCGQAPYRHLLGSSSYLGIDRTHRVGGAAVVADVAALPIAGASFDAVMCTEVIEHVPDERALARELARVARPGATLLLSSPFVHGLHEQPYDFRRLTSIGLVSILEEAGWEVTSIASIGGPVVVAVDSAVRATDSFVRRAARRVPGASGVLLRLLGVVSAGVQRGLGALALKSPFGHLRPIDPYRPSPRLTLGYVVSAQLAAAVPGTGATTAD